MKVYELLIFDWDGTLVDSPAHIVAGMQETITDLGLPAREDMQIAELIGLGMSDGMSRLFPELDLAQLLRQLKQHRRQAPGEMAAAPLFQGVLESLGVLHAAGYRLAVATGKHRDGFDRSLAKHAEVAAMIEIARCADESANKPHPLMLQQILEVTGVRSERALMIGDTEYDMAMAAAAGILALGVNCGVHTEDRLRRAGAFAVIENVAALPRWLADC